MNIRLPSKKEKLVSTLRTKRSKYLNRPATLSFRLFLFATFMMVLCLEIAHASQSPYQRLLRQAHEKYNQYKFSEAVDLYHQVLQRERACTEARIHLARSYNQLRQFENAVAQYRKLEDSLQLPTEDILLFAQALESTQEYADALQWYEQYQKKQPQPHIANKIEYLRELDPESLIQPEYTIQKLPINSKTSDFAPAFYQEGIVFASSRPTPKGRDKVYGWHQQPFLNLYYTKSTEDSAWSAPTLFSSDINTDYHEGSLIFYNNDQSVIFTRNVRPGKQKGKVLRLQLFLAEREGNEWKNIRAFDHNDWSYSVGHPAITEDGQQLYFVSDQPGGIGGTDLYVSHWRKGAWSTPKNVGKHINTPGDELFPFIRGNDLFFASDGLAGLGGLDIFRVPLKGTEKPISLGIPVNSSADDFGYIVDSANAYGYFSSNRDARQSGDDDLYYFSTRSSLEQSIEFIVMDSVTHQPIPNADILIRNKLHNTEKTLRTNQEGKLQIALQEEHKYWITASSVGYETSKQRITVDSQGQHPHLLPLALKSLVASGVIRDTDSGKPVDGVDLTLEDQEGRQQKQRTDTTGWYAFPLKPDQDYKLKVEKEDYFNQTISFDTQEKTKGVLDVVPKTEKIVVGKAIRIDKLHEMENIYYGLDKWEIQPEAAKELDQLVQLLKDNPTVHIELSAHTDVRGNASYNLRLSELRSMSAMSYITARGIDSGRIVAKGYGEQKLINQCRDGVKCSEQQHYQNRRTEFTVTKY